MTSEQGNCILHKIKSDNYNFGQSLRYIRKEQSISLRRIAKAVNKTPTYLSDIERGNNRPPEFPLLQELIKALELEESQTEIRDYLYDSAAGERGEVSGDIMGFVMEQAELRKLIRLAQQKKNIGELWHKCIAILQ